MYNYTWNPDPNGDQFFLGALLLRGTFRPEDAGTWGSVVKKARYHLILFILRISSIPFLISTNHFFPPLSRGRAFLV